MTETVRGTKTGQPGSRERRVNREEKTANMKSKLNYNIKWRMTAKP